MSRLGTKLVLMAGAMALVGFLDVGEADAFTCSSACNQIRRACVHVGKAGAKVAFANCEDNRDACRVACEANPGSCTLDCAATCAVICVGAGDPIACEADCIAGCPTDCIGCCNFTRVACRATARAERRDARLLCNDSRAGCLGTCVSVEPKCVQACKSGQRPCLSAAKRQAIDCKKKDCPTGTERRACVRGCRRDMNLDFKLCLNAEILCMGGCITP